MLRVSSTRRAVGQSTLHYSTLLCSLPAARLESTGQERAAARRRRAVLCCALSRRLRYFASRTSDPISICRESASARAEQRRAERGTCIAVRGDVCLFGFCFGANAAANCSTLLQSMLQSDINNGSYGPFVKYCAILMYCTEQTQ